MEANPLQDTDPLSAFCRMLSGPQIIVCTLTSSLMRASECAVR